MESRVKIDAIMNFRTCKWEDLGYKPHLTDDGSPTLIIANSQKTDQHDAEVREKMHSWEGAFSETIHLYEPAIRQSFRTAEPHIASIGFGLGYVEILLTCLSIQAERVDVSCESFEKNPILLEIFLRYLDDPESLGEELRQTYTGIFERFATAFSISEKIIRHTMLSLVRSEKLLLRDALTEATQFRQAPTCFIWDAYGRRFSQALWSDDYLKNALRQANPRASVFASYASFAALKLALREFQFTNTKMRGFGKKKESSIFCRPETF